MENAISLYLDLMEQCLTNTIYADAPQNPGQKDYSPEKREIGGDWPSLAHTMIGLKRLHNLRELCEQVLREQVPGDFIETGIWRGGACIMMRAVLKAYGITDRTVWCADSFEGLPKPDEAAFPQDRGDTHHQFKVLAISQEQVQANFEKYGLLDGQVKFLKGWFRDTLPSCPVERLAILRLDGDMYESTIEAIEALYDKVSPGGYVIVDDFGAVKGCRAAIRDFAERRGLRIQVQKIDWTGVYWRK